MSIAQANDVRKESARQVKKKGGNQKKTGLKHPITGIPQERHWNEPVPKLKHPITGIPQERHWDEPVPKARRFVGSGFTPLVDSKGVEITDSCGSRLWKGTIKRNGKDSVCVVCPGSLLKPPDVGFEALLYDCEVEKKSPFVGDTSDCAQLINEYTRDAVWVCIVQTRHNPNHVAQKLCIPGSESRGGKAARAAYYQPLPELRRVG